MTLPTASQQNYSRVHGTNHQWTHPTISFNKDDNPNGQVIPWVTTPSERLAIRQVVARKTVNTV